MNTMHLQGYRKFLVVFNFLRLPLNQFLQFEIIQKSSSVQNITRITAMLVYICDMALRLSL